MTGYLIAGVIIVLAVFVTLCRIAPLRRWLGYATWLDILFTVAMFSLFHDTFSGVMAACFAGLLMAVMLTVLRHAIGWERAKFYTEGFKLKVRWVAGNESRTPMRKPKFIRVLQAMWGARNA